MGHKKWDDMTSMVGTGWITEHNALYDAWEVERDRAKDAVYEKRFAEGQCARLSWLAEQAEKDLDEARKRIAELESPIRVPFSDAQIERMAVGLRQSYCEHYGITADGVLPDYYKELIRAALEGE